MTLAPLYILPLLLLSALALRWVWRAGWRAGHTRGQQPHRRRTDPR